MQTATLEELKACWMEDSDDYELVQEENSPDDHGYGFTMVFKRRSDGTYWETGGVCQSGGDYHELRELCSSDPVQVYPHTITTTVYKDKPANG